MSSNADASGNTVADASGNTVTTEVILQCSGYPNGIFATQHVGTRYNGEPTQNVSKYELDMRRKSETLKYKKNASNMSSKMQYGQIARGNYSRKKVWATQSDFYTNPNVNNLPYENNIISACPDSQNIYYYTAAQSDVPGNKSFRLFNDDTIPLTRYVPVKRTYVGSNNTKWPETKWQSSSLGFPNGKSGSNI